MADKNYVSGFCAQATMIGRGLISTKADTGQWHLRCRGGVANGNGTVVMCKCPCHVDRPVCRNCGRAEVELTDLRTCLDVEGCADHLYASSTNGSPLRTQLAECRGRGESDRAKGRAERQARSVANPELSIAPPVRSARPARPTKQPQLCHCGCGGMTKGGQFCMGHDMKLKGQLFEQARLHHDPGAAAELLARGWSRAGVAATTIDAAEAAMESEGPDLLVQRAVKVRYGR